MHQPAAGTQLQLAALWPAGGTALQALLAVPSPLLRRPSCIRRVSCCLSLPPPAAAAAAAATALQQQVNKFAFLCAAAAVDARCRQARFELPHRQGLQLLAAGGRLLRLLCLLWLPRATLAVSGASDMSSMTLRRVRAVMLSRTRSSYGLQPGGR